MRRLFFVLALAGLAGSALAQAPRYVWHLPPGVRPPPVPADNPMSEAKVALGRRLFYDADLSRDGTTSCGTCHEQHRAFTEGNATHPGVGGVKGRRNVMALANVGYFTPLTFADSSQASLEGQMLVPLKGTHPVEMGMAGKEDELARRLAADPCYRQMFAAAFPETKGRIDVPAVGKAIAAFERTLISRDAPFDRFRRGDLGALSPTAKKGMAEFKSLQCDSCHAGTAFTDLHYHAIGSGKDDHGLIEITHRPADQDAFRTPSLRNVALTEPYLHDGSAKTLAEAIRRHPGGAGIDDGQIEDLTRFLESLSDLGFVTDKRFSLPALACGKPNG